MSSKYWETEIPVVLSTAKNQIRVFAVAKKVQVYPICANTAHGVGKGTTIDLESATKEEVQQIKDVLNGVFDEILNN